MNALLRAPGWFGWVVSRGVSPERVGLPPDEAFKPFLGLLVAAGDCREAFYGQGVEAMREAE